MKEFEFIKKVMGTEFSLLLVCDDKKKAEGLSQKIFEMAEKYENIFSRFKDDSELGILNRKKEKKVSYIFGKAFLEARRLGEITEGRFNPLFSIKDFGYEKSFEKMDKNELVRKNLKEGLKRNFNFNEIEFNQEEKIIKLKENQILDFGGFLKGGFLEEVKKDVLEKEGIKNFILNLGGDILTRGRGKDGEKFIFWIGNPISQKDEIKMEMENFSLATSGHYKRKGKVEEKEVSHILDKGGNAFYNREIVSISVFTKSSSEADAGATSLASLKRDEIFEIAKEKKFNFILIDKIGEIYDNF